MFATKFLGPRFLMISSQEERMMWDLIDPAGLLRLEFPTILFLLRNVWALARDGGRSPTSFLKELHLHFFISWPSWLGIILTSLSDIFKANLRTYRSFALIIWCKLLVRFVELAHAPAQCSFFLLAFQQQ